MCTWIYARVYAQCCVLRNKIRTRRKVARRTRTARVCMCMYVCSLHVSPLSSGRWWKRSRTLLWAPDWNEQSRLGRLIIAKFSGEPRCSSCMPTNEWHCCCTSDGRALALLHVRSSIRRGQRDETNFARSNPLRKAKDDIYRFLKFIGYTSALV